MRRMRVESRRVIRYLMEQEQLLGRDPERQWRLRAACRGLDTELFFPDNVLDSEIPMRVCRNCPVQVECFADRSVWGVWGGTTEWERSDFLRGQARAWL